MAKFTFSVLFLWSLVAAIHAAPTALSPSPAPAKPAVKSAPGTDIPVLPPVEATTKSPAPTQSAATAAATTAAPGTEEPVVGKDAETAAADAAAQAEAENIQVDLSSIPKLAPVGEVVTTGASTSVGQNNTKSKTAKSEEVPLDGFEPVWPKDKPYNKDQILIDVVTDSSLDTVKTNQIPFIQSLADALGISTNDIYWYKITSSELNTVWFLVDTKSEQQKQATLASLANADNTARFYTNAAAYTLNILNGPEVAPEELNLSQDVISTPDKASAYNGDTGVITNNGTATSSARMAGGHGAAGFGYFVMLVSFTTAWMISTILM